MTEQKTLASLSVLVQSGKLDPVDLAKETYAAIDAHGDYNTPATTASGYLGGTAGPPEETPTWAGRSSRSPIMKPSPITWMMSPALVPGTGASNIA